VLEYLANGVRVVDTAAELHITAHSVTRFKNTVMQRVGVATMEEVFAWWSKQPYRVPMTKTARRMIAERSVARDAHRSRIKREKCRINGMRTKQTPVTVRQAQILHLVQGGMLNKEIGHRLEISEKCVRNHLTAAYRSLDVRNRVEAAVKWKDLMAKV